MSFTHKMHFRVPAPRTARIDPCRVPGPSHTPLTAPTFVHEVVGSAWDSGRTHPTRPCQPGWSTGASRGRGQDPGPHPALTDRVGPASWAPRTQGWFSDREDAQRSAGYTGVRAGGLRSRGHRRGQRPSQDSIPRAPTVQSAITRLPLCSQSGVPEGGGRGAVCWVPTARHREPLTKRLPGDGRPAPGWPQDGCLHPAWHGHAGRALRASVSSSAKWE